MIGAFVSRSLGIALLAVLSLGAVTPLSAQDGPTHIYVLQADLERIGSFAEEGESDARQLFESSLKLIRNRLRGLNVTTHAITDEGDGRVVIEISGEGSTAAVRSALGFRPDIAFRMADEDVSPKDIQRGLAPAGSEILPMADGSGVVAVTLSGGISGRYIANARTGFDSWSNRPVVMVDFDKEGTRMLAELTSAHVMRPMAIVIDGKIISAPTITGPILDGSMQISGNFTYDGANELAMMLRSGDLPVPFVLVEERVVE